MMFSQLAIDEPFAIPYHNAHQAEERDSACVLMMDTSLFIVVVAIAGIAGVLLLAYCLRRYEGFHANLDGLVFAPADEPLLRENLKDSFLEEGRFEWQCVVCAHLNHPDKTTCVLCGAAEVMVNDLKCSNLTVFSSTRTLKTIGSTVLLVSAPSVDGFVEEDGGVHNGDEQKAALLPETRQRALRYRRHNMQLNQRQRQAKRRRLWQRAHLANGNYVWVRTSTFVDLEGNLDDTFLLSIANKPRTSTGALPTSLQEMLHRKNAASMGFVTQTNRETGRLVWKKANSHTGEDDHDDDLMCLEAGFEVDLEGLMALPFNQKKTWFVKKIARLAIPFNEACYSILVRRAYVLQDSVAHFTAAAERGRFHEHLQVTFEGEAALDAGGVLREWFGLVCTEIFSGPLGLFSTTHAENQSYWINPAAEKAFGKYYLHYFRFAGWLLGHGILEGLVLDAYLALPLLKHILGVPISFSDLEYLDEELYRNCVWVRDNSGVDALALTFSIQNAFGEEVDLKPNGHAIDVTDANKMEYLNLVLEYKMLGSIAEPLQELLTGLYEIIPRAMLNVFDYQELEFYMCGVPCISVDDWKKNSTIRYFPGMPRAKQTEVVDWFWSVVEQFNDEERGRLLQFTTGSSRLPVEGFKGLTSFSGQIHKFTIQMVQRGNPPAGLCPKAHTCFNRIDLPLYKDRNELENYLSLVIQMEITESQVKILSDSKHSEDLWASLDELIKVARMNEENDSMCILTILLPSLRLFLQIIASQDLRLDKKKSITAEKLQSLGSFLCTLIHVIATIEELLYPIDSYLESLPCAVVYQGTLIIPVQEILVQLKLHLANWTEEWFILMSKATKDIIRHLGIPLTIPPTVDRSHIKPSQYSLTILESILQPMADLACTIPNIPLRSYLIQMIVRHVLEAWLDELGNVTKVSEAGSLQLRKDAENIKLWFDDIDTKHKDMAGYSKLMALTTLHRLDRMLTLWRQVGTDMRKRRSSFDVMVDSSFKH
ncbi:HECT E3 ubiquitin ligase [Thraustotheca clavata]|uniref:HECT-type E3 ubiquitin transferase n=1 Tax=Thraustotheca clavata TaxID=74557 RepID=A0A1V9ZX64_9STRA|nr:HECT E3 ubiquitin ligase [Thraustotheca clavata]